MFNLVLTLLLLNVICGNSKYEGDHCNDDRTSSSGICKLINNCASAKYSIRNGVFPKTCGFQGNQVIVCCIEAARIKMVKRTPGKKAIEMCEKYIEYALRKTSVAVVGGTEAIEKEFPYMVQLGYGENASIAWACGGSLLSDQYVLTAAHCLEHRQLGLVLYARMGLTDLHNKHKLQQYDIIERIPHPNYSAPALYHDIALVKFKEKADFNNFVRPACISTLPQSPPFNVEAIGWGSTEFWGSDTSVLRKVTLELYSQTECNKVYRAEIKTGKLKDGIRDAIMICAGHSKELKDTCQGDSGGPLQLESISYFRYDIIGVTSFGKGCALEVGIPGVYTRISYYVKWIEDIVWPA